MPTPVVKFIKDLFLPELKFVKLISSPQKRQRIYLMEKVSEFEVCPKCASKSHTVYDHVVVTIRDTPLRSKNVILKIRKRRFLCKPCKKVFREPVQGIFKGFRTTQRYRHHVMWNCTQFSNLKRVADVTGCSEWLVYKCHYEQLELETRKLQSEWPTTVGIDEHSFQRKYGRKEFVTVFVDYNNRKVREVILGRAPADILESENILKIRSRERVKNVVIDLSSGFKLAATTLFPNAIITADKFHVIKLIFPAIMKYKKEIVSNTRNRAFKRLLLKNGHKLKFHESQVLRAVLHFYPTLKDLYTAKEAIHSLYRCKGYKNAKRSFTKFTDWLAYSKIPELQTLRRTLIKWREEILNYFKTRITNARTEGFNRKAKLIQRNAYGFKNFNNYRLKILYSCR
ncbi:MAG: ISL3 family transposase [Bacteriovorax sp.]|nr:ISL3 family transposase [Bacteriovorax sp.]